MISGALAILESEEERNELSAFYEKYKNRLYAIAISKLHNEMDAEYVIQDVFLEIADKPERFFAIPEEKRIAYANVMVRNISIDKFNSKHQVPMDVLDEEMGCDDVPLDNNLLGKIARDELIEFVKQLPEAQRDVLILRCFFDLSIDETAEKLDISLAAANKRLLSARKAVRRFVEERNSQYE